MNNIARQSAETERQTRSEKEQGSNDNAYSAKDQKGPSEFAEWVHNASLKPLSFEVKAERISESNQLVASEKVADLKGRRIGRVGTMRDVGADTGTEIVANGSGRRLLGIRGAHGVAPFRDGTFGFEDHRENLSGAHKIR